MAKNTRPSPREPRRWLVLSAWLPELDEFPRLLAGQAKDIALAPAGVGLVEAAMGAALAIARDKPEAVIFVGTAGLYQDQRPDLRIGEVVAARGLHLRCEAVEAGHAYFPAPLPTTLATLPRMRRRAAALGLPLLDVACPLAITSRKVAAAEPEVENLEAFAVGRAAARLHLPFMALLGISNFVGPKAHAQWKKHAGPAAAAACQAAYAFITGAPAGSGRPFHRAGRGQ